MASCNNELKQYNFFSIHTVVYIRGGKSTVCVLLQVKVAVNNDAVRQSGNQCTLIKVVTKNFYFQFPVVIEPVVTLPQDLSVCLQAIEALFKNVMFYLKVMSILIVRTNICS
jgi:hypothetical protein